MHFRGCNLTSSFLHHWPRFSVHRTESPWHRPPVDFHTTEEWIMTNLHFACDFVFDVTRSLLIMQWTRRECTRSKASLFTRGVCGRETAIAFWVPFFLYTCTYRGLLLFLTGLWRCSFTLKHNMWLGCPVIVTSSLLHYVLLRFLGEFLNTNIGAANSAPNIAFKLFFPRLIY